MNLKYYLRGLGLGLIVAGLILGIHHYRNSGTPMSDAQIKARAEELGMVEASTTLSEKVQPDAEELLESIDNKDNPPQKEEIPPVSDDVALDDVTSEISQTVHDDPDAAGNKDSDAGESGESEDAGTGTDDTQEASQETGETSEAANEPEENTDNDQADNTEPEAAPESDAAAEAPAEENKPDDSNVNVVGGSVTIVSGDSSDRVARKLEEAGIVSSAAAFDKYLCSNGYDRYIRTGSFNIPAGSSDQDIAKLITGR